MEETIVRVITEVGLPAALCIFLLSSFQKKLDRLITVIDRLTGILLVMSKTEGRDVDNGSSS